MRRKNENTEQRKLLLHLWVVAMIAFIVPQVFTAIAYHRLADLLTKPIQVEHVNENHSKDN